MKILLIDGSNLIFRAYYATQDRPMLTLDQRPANAIHSLITMINKMIKDYQPTHLFIALDESGGTFRHEQYEDYKGKRISIPEELRIQIPMAKELYDSMKIKYDSMQKYEADDLIASYARQAEREGFEVLVLSGDKDLLQLVSEKITVITPKIGFSKEVRYTPEVFFEKYNFEPKRFIEYKSLVGDSSDNIKGVSKVGDKTAKKLINQYENIEKMIEAANDGEIKGVVGQNIANCSEVIEENTHLVTLVENVNLNYDLSELEFTHFNGEKFIKFLKECGFTKLLTQYEKQLGINKDSVSLETKKITYKLIFKFDENVHVSEKENFIYAQNLSANYHESTCIGFALHSDKGTFVYEYNKAIKDEEFINFIKNSNNKVIYDVKKIMSLLNVKEINNNGIDVKLALELIDHSNVKREYDAQMMSYGVDYIKTFEQVYQKKTKPIIPEDKSIMFTDLASKAVALSDIHINLLNDLEASQMHKILYDIEMPLSIVLAKMEIDGVKIDVELLQELKKQYEEEINNYVLKLKEYADINFDSTKQLSELLFIEKELPTKGIKKTKTAYSTDASNLEKLQNLLIFDKEKYTQDLEFVDNLLSYRKLKKIHSVYLVGLENQQTNGYLHPIYHQLLTETGRLSVTDPNIQNIPIRSDEGQIIRKLFSAPENYLFSAIDYSQVELRIISHLANEEHMINDFKNDMDIHSQTAKKILGTDEITPNQRSKAKAINFGIIYGMSKYGLSTQLKISAGEAEDFINKYFENYPSIENYMKSTIEHAQKNGYVETFFGRKRFINGINSKNHMERESAKRIAINTPVQGTAADVIKIAMIQVDQLLTDKYPEIKMVMQIHDELVFYIPIDSKKAIDEIKNIMENVVKFNVKLIADYGIGENWLQTK